MVALATATSRGREERGFTLIELLVVILIIGILAAIAIPNLLGQQHKAYSAAAKELVTSAQNAAETIGTDHEGSYGSGGTSYVTPASIHEYEKTIPVSSTQANGGAWLVEAEAIDGGTGYKVVTLAPKTNGETFTIERTENGEVLRTCAPTDPTYGCQTGSW